MSRVAGLGAALVALCTACGCCGHASPTYTVRHGAALSPPPAPPLAASVRALHLADFGDTTCQQAAVAGAVAEAHRRAPFDLALFPGDNVYQCGPDPAVPGAEGCRFADDQSTVAAGFASPPDASFGRHEDALAALTGIPVYLALGNHDVAAEGGCAAGDPAVISRRRACLEVAHASPLWTMPGRHYVVDRGPARFIVVDSNLLKGDYGGFTFEEEEAFVAQAARGCDARTCFLVGHHPPAAAGSHRDDGTPDYLARVERLVRASGGMIRAWLAGHDHALEHLRGAAGFDVLVSGNGARGRPSQRFLEASAGAALLFASVRWGYGILEVGADGWRYRFESDEGTALYCCAATGAGPCEPVSCRDGG